MKLKQKFTAILAALLILPHVFPPFTVSAEGVKKTGITTMIEGSGAPPKELPDQGSYMLTRAGKIASPSDADNTDKPEIPEDGDDLTGWVPGVQTPSDAQPPEIALTEQKTESEVPIFSAGVVTDGGVPGVYGTLSFIPKNVMDISVEYSFGGESYYFVDGGSWVLDEVLPDSSLLTQLCMKLDERPYTVWENGTVNSLYIRLSISCYNSDDIRTEAVLFSHDKTYPIPETPPPFTAEIYYSYGGYQVDGHFESFPPDVVSISPMYSLDGKNYRMVGDQYHTVWGLEGLGTEDEEEKYYLENQCIMTYSEEPLASYVAGKLDRFYLRLQITTESGVYDTQSALIRRGSAKPIPDNTFVRADIPFTMRPLDEWGSPIDVAYGQYQVTVKEDASPEAVYALLPDTLPVEVQIRWQDSGEVFATGIVSCAATWKDLSSIRLTAGESLTIPDAVDQLIVPAGTEFSTPVGNYFLPASLTFDRGAGSGEVRLVIDTVSTVEGPDVSLRENTWENTLEDIGALSVAFRKKPSGANSIKAYSFVEGDEDWTEICDLLTLRDLNHNQAMPLYGFITLLQPEHSPFQEYLSEGRPFLIGLSIEGGTFDGEKVILPWPGEYNPPAGIPEPGGSEGNENNAGSGDGSGDSSDTGQRPNLSEEGKPPVTNPSLMESESEGDFVLLPPLMPPSAPSEEEAIGEILPPFHEPPMKSELLAVNPPPVEQESTSMGQNDPDSTDQAISNPIKFSALNEGEPQEKSDLLTAVNGDTKKIGGRATAVAVLLLGGGITTAAFFGNGSGPAGMAGTGPVVRLRTTLNKIFKRP